MRILKVGYSSFEVPDKVNIGEVVETLSRLKLLEKVYRNGNLVLFRSNQKDISITEHLEYIASSEEDAIKYAVSLPKE